MKYPVHGALVLLLLLFASCAPSPQDKALDQLEEVVRQLEAADTQSDPALLGTIVARIEEIQSGIADSRSELTPAQGKRATELLNRSASALESLSTRFFSTLQDQ